MRGLPTILCRACGGAGQSARSLSTHAGLGGTAAVALGPCPVCRGARWEPDPHAVERLVEALAELQACVLASVPWPRTPSVWWDVNDGLRALALAAGVAVPPAEAPLSTGTAITRTRAAVAALDALLVYPSSVDAHPRARLLGAAWELLAEGAARLPSVGVEAVATARTEGRA